MSEDAPSGTPQRAGIGPLLAGVGGLAVVLVAFLLYVGPEPPTAPIQVGRPAPDFSLPSLSGEPVSLESLRGKVVYVNFWATWCVPCRDEAPALQRLYHELHADGFEIVAPTIDAAGDLAKIEAFRDEFGIEFPILRDIERTAYQSYGATGVPETYLIDQDGRIAEAYIGPRDWDEPKYGRAVRRLLDARNAMGDPGRG